MTNLEMMIKTKLNASSINSAYFKHLSTNLSFQRSAWLNVAGAGI